MRFGFANRGRTCNCFWSYVSLLNVAMNTSSRILVPIFDPTIGDYPRLLHCGWLRFPFYNRLMLCVFGLRRSRSLAVLLFDNRLWNYRTLCDRYPFRFINGYNLRYNLIEDKNKEAIRDFFVPVDAVSVPVLHLFDYKRESFRKIIGVHIRRGDYCSWHGGRYFFGFDVYADACRKLVRMFGERDVVFFFASEEPVPQDPFYGVPFFQTPDRTVTQDLYALSLCDCVVGPPSSFSRFAAFRGNIPIAFLMEESQERFDFRVLDNCSFFSEGGRVDDVIK